MYTLKKNLKFWWPVQSSFHTDRKRTPKSVKSHLCSKAGVIRVTCLHSGLRVQDPSIGSSKSPTVFAHMHTFCLLFLLLLPMVRSQSICLRFLSHAGLAWENRKRGGRCVVTPQLQSSAAASGCVHWTNRSVTTPLFDGTRVFSDVIWDSRAVEQEPHTAETDWSLYTSPH